MGAEQSELSQGDQWSAEDSSCTDCNVAICGTPYCTHLFKDMPDKKTYIFYARAASKYSYTLGSTGTVSQGGPTCNVNASVTTNIGDYMIKMLRKDGERHRCIKCFHNKHPTLLKSVALTVKGKAWLINSDMTLNPASYGDMTAR